MIMDSIRCDISVSCVLNVCKANGYCIVKKCSLKTKQEVKDFVEGREQIRLIGYTSDSVSKFIPPEDVSSFYKKKKKAKIINEIIPPIKYNDWRFETTKNSCFYCTNELVDPRQIKNPNSRTKDHILPKLFGGGKGNNIVWSCRRCNLDKGSLFLERWLLKVRDTWDCSDDKTEVIKTIKYMLTKLNPQHK